MEFIVERRKHLGPTMQYARVGFRVEPAAAFEVVNFVSDDEVRSYGFPDTFIRGLREGLGKDGPVPPFRLVLTLAEHHPIDSSPQAFIEAGRDAARQLREMADAS